MATCEGVVVGPGREDKGEERVLSGQATQAERGVMLTLGVVLLGPLGSAWRGPSSWSAWLS